MFEKVCDTLILALGNPLCGDDGVGTAVLEALATRENLPDGVMFSQRGVNGLLCALIGQHWRRIMLVDAANLGRPPGEWRRFTLDTVHLAAGGCENDGFGHRATLTQALALAEPFAPSFPEIVIYGIQPLTVAPGTRLSAPVRKAIGPVCRAIWYEVCQDRSREWAAENEQSIAGRRTEISCPRF